MILNLHFLKYLSLKNVFKIIFLNATKLLNDLISFIVYNICIIFILLYIKYVTLFINITSVIIVIIDFTIHIGWTES